MSKLDELLEESGLGGDHALAALLAPLAEQPPAPAPSRELAAVFAGVRLVVTAPSRAARATRAAAAAGVAAVLSVGGTGLAAAANTLPAPLQHRVSEFSHRYLPFDFPRPGERPGGEHGVVPAPVLGQPRPGEPAPEAEPAAPPLRLRDALVTPPARAAAAAPHPTRSTDALATPAPEAPTAPSVESTKPHKGDGKSQDKPEDKQPKDEPRGGGDATVGDEASGTDQGDPAAEAVPIALRPPSTTPVTPPADDPGAGGDTRSSGNGAQGGAKGRGAGNGGAAKSQKDASKAPPGRAKSVADVLVGSLPLVVAPEQPTVDDEQVDTPDDVDQSDQSGSGDQDQS